MFRWNAYIGPCEGIQARDIGLVAYSVDGQEDRQNDECHGYEDAKQELQVLEEEIAIDTGDADKLRVANGEDIPEGFNGSDGG